MKVLLIIFRSGPSSAVVALALILAVPFGIWAGCSYDGTPSPSPSRPSPPPSQVWATNPPTFAPVDSVVSALLAAPHDTCLDGVRAYGATDRGYAWYMTKVPVAVPCDSPVATTRIGKCRDKRCLLVRPSVGACMALKQTNTIYTWFPSIVACDSPPDPKHPNMIRVVDVHEQGYLGCPSGQVFGNDYMFDRHFCAEYV